MSKQQDFLLSEINKKLVFFKEIRTTGFFFFDNYYLPHICGTCRSTRLLNANLTSPTNKHIFLCQRQK